jgi:hypothetical protein
MLVLIASRARRRTSLLVRMAQIDHVQSVRWLGLHYCLDLRQEAASTLGGAPQHFGAALCVSL